MKRITVWDLPLRLFHWLLLISVAISFISIKFLDDIDMHFASGVFVLALIVFRVLWGFCGSQTARFAGFLPSFNRLKEYFFGSKKLSVGHSPLAGLATLVLLGSLCVQAVSGLFLDDEIYFTGPLNALVSSEAVEILAKVHEWNQQLLLILIGMHIVAIIFYLVIKKDNLILPMVHGKKMVNQAIAKSNPNVGKFSLLLFFICLIFAIVVGIGLYRF